MVRGSSRTSSQMTVMNLPVDVEPKTCGRPVRRLRPVRPMLPESRKFRDLPGWDGLIQSTGGGSRTHTGVSAQRNLNPRFAAFAGGFSDPGKLRQLPFLLLLGQFWLLSLDRRTGQYLVRASVDARP